MAQRIRELGRQALTLKADVRLTGGCAGASWRARARGRCRCQHQRTPDSHTTSIRTACTPVHPQVRDRPGVEQSMKEAAEQLGGINILVANAGGWVVAGAPPAVVC